MVEASGRGVINHSPMEILIIPTKITGNAFKSETCSEDKYVLTVPALSVNCSWGRGCFKDSRNSQQVRKYSPNIDCCYFVLYRSTES